MIPSIHIKWVLIGVGILSVFLIICGVYFWGYSTNEKKWQLKVKELEVKVAEAKAESEKVNVQIVEKIVTKTQVVKERGKNLIQYVDREIVKYDSKCEIPDEAIISLNEATERNKK